ncbi:MAG: hypothetical protein CSA68_10545 [Rhodobacterales bacterium]|nr:MAG: hypothetical protein CSA68_10545 [Rhodobacterales bacterium]
MGRTDQGYELRFEKPLESVDTGRIFQKISHDRVADVRVSKGKKRISVLLNCKCHADAFEFRPGMLVVDIKDGPAPARSRFETSFASDEISKNPVAEEIKRNSKQPALHSDLKGGTSPENALPLVMAPMRLDQDKKLENLPGSRELSAALNAQKTPRHSEIGRMQSEILREIGRAASQGLLQADIQIPKPTSTNKHPAKGGADTAPSPVASNDHMNLYVESSIDRELVLKQQSHHSTGSESVCLTDEIFDLAAWGDPDSVMSEIIKQRGQVLREFDKVSEESVEKLAKAYIYAGFGAEAKSILRAFGVEPKHGDILRTMAEIVDGRSHNFSVNMESQIECSTSAALWAVLTVPDLPKRTKINEKAILSSFARLPHHIQHFIGPRLSQKFLDFGDVETARSLRNMTVRHPDEPGAELQLLDARLDSERGLHEQAKQSLQDIVEQDNDMAPQALIALLEKGLADDGEVDTYLIETAESHVFEQKNTEVGAELQRLIILLRAKEGNLQAALSRLRDLEKSYKITRKKQNMIWQSVLDIALQNKNREKFLRFVFAARQDLEEWGIPRNTRRKIASLLLDEGLVDMAREILSVGKAPYTADDKFLLARAELLAGNPEAALQYLEEMSEARAIKLRAQAYSQMGDHQRAAQEYESIDDEKKRQSEIWRAGNWSELSKDSAGSVRMLAQTMLAGSSTRNEVVPSAAEAMKNYNSLLNDSAQTRTYLEDLLHKYPSPDQ